MWLCGKGNAASEGNTPSSSPVNHWSRVAKPYIVSIHVVNVDFGGFLAKIFSIYAWPEILILYTAFSGLAKL